MNVKYPKSLDLRSPEQQIVDKLVTMREMSSLQHLIGSRPKIVDRVNGDNIYQAEFKGKKYKFRFIDRNSIAYEEVK